MSAGRPRYGYASSSPDLSGPGDRRRFCHWAASRGIAFEPADPARHYDVVVANAASDLTVWSRLPRDTRFVFDMVDSYLAVRGDDWRAKVRGVAKFAFGRTRHLHLDYRRLIEDTCRRADAVICTTEEQRRDISALCPNVHVILDFQTELGDRVKQDYRRGDALNLVWEGLPFNVGGFAAIRDVLAAVRRERPVALHLVTDLRCPLAFGDTWRVDTRRLVDRVLPRDGVYLHEWNRELLAGLCIACDLAVIPIRLEDPFMAGKPENKQVLFWRLGLPVLTSATPAYTRAAAAAGVESACATEADWRRLLERAAADEGWRREQGQRGLAHAREHYSEARLLARWDEVLASIPAR